MKKRLISAIICLLFLSILSMYGGYNLDRFLSQGVSACSAAPLIVLSGAWTGKAKLLTLLFIAASAFGILFLTLMPEYIKYKSAMHEIVPGMKTPETAGQGQYGTAHWLPKSQIPKVFATAEIDKNSPLMQGLLNHGYDDLQEKKKETFKNAPSFDENMQKKGNGYEEDI